MTRLSAVVDGRLTIPLFHGTSSLFYDSICTFGLGGRNVVEEMEVRKAARVLLELCQGCNVSDNLLSAMKACERIAADPATDRLGDGSYFSFRYGGTYLSPCRETAATYAFLYHEGGGEAISHTLKLYQQLMSVRHDLGQIREIEKLLALPKAERKPLVVEAQNVEVSSLRSEQGGSIHPYLKKIQAGLDGGDDVDDILYGQTNFELVGVVPENKLLFYEPSKKVIFDENAASMQVLELRPFEKGPSHMRT